MGKICRCETPRARHFLITANRPILDSRGNSRKASRQPLCSLGGMAGWKHFNEIVAWQLAEEVKLRVYAFLDRPSVQKKYAYCDNMARASRSGPSNIAEGFGRFGNKVFANHARIAKASLVEVLNHFIDARDQRLLTKEEFLLEEHPFGTLRWAARRPSP